MTNLEVVLLGLASHDDVESLVRVLGTSLDAVGHILLVLVRVQPHAECSCVTSQFGLRIRTLSQTQRRSIEYNYTVQSYEYVLLHLPFQHGSLL